MDTLFSEPQHSTVDRAQPWYGQYYTRVSFDLPYAHVLRLPNHKAIDRQMAIRQQWANEMMRSGNGSWITSHFRGEINDTVIGNLHTLFDFFKSQPDRRFLTAPHQVSFYTNSNEAVDQLTSFSFVKSPEIVRLNVIGKPDTIYRSRSKFLYRSYFKYRNASKNEAALVLQYLLSQEDVKLSPNLTLLHQRGYKVFQHYHFFDHMSPSTAQMLGLVSPGLVRKTLEIKTDK